MEQRTLGSQGLVVSAMGLGCMGMSGFYGATDEQASVGTIRRALDLGVTFLDTADMWSWPRVTTSCPSRAPSVAATSKRTWRPWASSRPRRTWPRSRGWRRRACRPGSRYPEAQRAARVNV